MERPTKEIFNRLGPRGLVRALDDLLDQSHLVRLANACGLKYPGMRTQSQRRDRLLADLVERAGKNDVARKAILRTLSKETARDLRDWEGLAPEEKVRRLCDESFLLSERNLGLHLFLLASQVEGSDLDGFGGVLAHQHLVRLASNGDGKEPTAARPAREEGRLRRKITELEKKARHLESQLSKTREAQKGFKRDLIQRKGELAESRMLAERLRFELAAAQTAAEVASAGGSKPAASDKTIADLAKAAQKVASEQKKLVQRLDKLHKPTPERTDAQAQKLLDAVDQLKKDFGRQRLEHKKELADQTRRIEELRSELRSRQASRETTTPKSSKRSRSKSQAGRVGVFINVQNMYYSARQLKGKLDFDALLHAAVQDRRLIQATAYVVESKENDQSQFIAMLQQRGIQVQRKALKVRADGSMKGNWDMELALDILDAAPKLNVVVLVSGDGDFTSLVKRVKGMGPRVEVIAFPRNTAKALLQAADHFEPLDRKFMIYTKSSKKASPKREPAAAAAPAEHAAAPKKASSTGS